MKAFTLRAAALSVAALFSSVSLAAADGVLTGEAQGRNGPVKVEVTMKDGKIADLKVVQHKESTGIADPALERIPAAAIAEQSLAVDVVGGATLTSEAILAAAVAAREAGAARVLVLEKAAVAGGHAMVSSGSVNAYDPEGQARMGRSDSLEAYFRDTFEGGGRAADPELVRTLVEGSESMLRWLTDMGVAFDPVLFEAYNALYPRSHRTTFSRSGYVYVRALMRRAKALGVASKCAMGVPGVFGRRMPRDSRHSGVQKPWCSQQGASRRAWRFVRTGHRSSEAASARPTALVFRTKTRRRATAFGWPLPKAPPCATWMP